MNLVIDRFNYFLFDLDNTLYPEIKYLDEAYLNISKFLENKTSIKSENIYEFLISRFKNKGRCNLFNEMFYHFKIDSIFLDDILTVLRNYKTQNKISLYPNYYDILPIIINNSKKVFVITNGNVIQQKNKVKNIEWNSIDKDLTFIYANQYKCKPSNESFNFIKNQYVLKEDKTIMIGDSTVDEQFAKNCGINFMFTNEFNSIDFF